MLKKQFTNMCILSLQVHPNTNTSPNRLSNPESAVLFDALKH